MGQVAAQNPPQTPSPPQPTAPRVRPEAYPQREPDDPAVVARGKTLYGINCQFCHGADARGGDAGPSLLRSQLVLNDQRGELIAPVVQNGRPDRGMPKIDLTADQIRDIAAFIHSFKVAGYDESRMAPTSILVGNAAAGQRYFAKTCAPCHSISGDLAGIGTRFPDAKVLQQTWLIPGSSREAPLSTLKVPPITATVTLASGERVEGRLRRIDDFTVTVIDADGAPRTFRRAGDTPKIDIKDPLKPHRDLLRTYSDADIHDVTAYLVTVK
jgi:cytochrome c oxidase cbb3-type subunit III